MTTIQRHPAAPIQIAIAGMCIRCGGNSADLEGGDTTIVYLDATEMRFLFLIVCFTCQILWNGL